MDYQLTPWGYEVEAGLPPLIDVLDFHEATGHKWESDQRVMTAINIASATIRDACGWHIAPNVACRCTVDGDGTRGIWLPTTCMTSLDSLEVAGVADADPQWSRIGRVIASHPLPMRLQAATVDYHAGLAGAPDSLMGIIAGVVVRSIALAYGVSSESVSGVSVSYSGGHFGGSPTATLTDVELAQLSAYKVVRAHAT